MIMFALFSENIPSDDGYENHFGVNPSCLSESSRTSVEARSWVNSREKIGKLGSAIVSVPSNSEASTSATASKIDVSYHCVLMHFVLTGP